MMKISSFHWYTGKGRRWDLTHTNATNACQRVLPNIPIVVRSITFTPWVTSHAHTYTPVAIAQRLPGKLSFPWKGQKNKWSNMYWCVYISLIYYIMEHVDLSFKIRYISKDFVLIHRWTLSLSMGVYGEGVWTQLARTLSFRVMIGWSFWGRIALWLTAEWGNQRSWSLNTHHSVFYFVFPS